MHKPAAWGLVVLVALSVTAVAAAEVTPGRSDETIQQAYPMQAGQVYSGAFQDAGYDDVDYLAFKVTQPNQTLEFSLANTTASCADPNDAGCPVYATLMDSSNHQVGGDNSEAGTIATNGDTEVFDWTFASPGTYYLLLESDGDLPPGSPSYTVRFTSPAPGSGGGGSGTGGSGGSTLPLLRSLHASAHQHGGWVRATVVLGRSAARLTATLSGRGFSTRISRRNLTTGAHRLAIRLPAGLRRSLARRHRISAALKVVVLGRSGQRASISRHVLLLG